MIGSLLLFRGAVRVRMTSETQQGQSGGNAVATKGVTFGFNPLGDITSIQRYTNITQAPSPATDAADTTLGYSSLGQLTSEDHSHNGSTLENLSWTFDTLDRVSTFSSNDGTATNAYDKNSQLTGVTYSGAGEPPNFSTSYDPNGNQNPSGYTVSPNNQVTNDGTFTYTFDAEGNRTSRKRISTAAANDYLVTYSWDYRNRLMDVEYYNSSNMLTQHVHYVYDVFNNLIERDLDPTGGGTYTQVAHYVWDIQSPLPPGEGQGEGGNGAADAAMGANIGSGSAAGAGEGGVVLQFNGNQQLTDRYLNGPNVTASDQYFSDLAEENVTSTNSPGTVTFNLLDNEDTLHDVVNASGTVEDHVVDTAFGELFSESNPATPHLSGYAGGMSDSATGLINFHDRWLDPASAVWLSVDPTGFYAGDTNLSRYVGNDPANAIDPSGLDEDGNSSGYVGVEQLRERALDAYERGDMKSVYAYREAMQARMGQPGFTADFARWQDNSNRYRGYVGGAAKMATGVIVVGGVFIANPVAGGYLASGLLTVGAGQSAYNRYRAGQTCTQIAVGVPADLSGFSGFYALNTNRDWASQRYLHLSPYEQGDAGGAGTVQLVTLAGGTIVAIRSFEAPTPLQPRNVFPRNFDDFLPELPRDPKGRIFPSTFIRIRPEQHPLQPGETFSPRHHGPHYHVEIRLDPNKSFNNPGNTIKIKPPGYKPGDGTGFLPGEEYP